MNKLGVDPKVKKTLVRNYEHKVKSVRNQVKHDVGTSKSHSGKSSHISQKENDLSQPALCSSEALARYLTDVKTSMPPPLPAEDLNVNKSQLGAKMTKKLNFHINDKIYKNLIELNANIAELKSRNNKRPLSSIMSIKKDLEPNIEDFYEDVKETDSPPHIPVIKPKYKSVKQLENGQLHKLVASFEIL